MDRQARGGEEKFSFRSLVLQPGFEKLGQTKIHSSGGRNGESPIPFLSGLIERHIESDLFRDSARTFVGWKGGEEESRS